ncbi:hypothetical protein CL655_01385 [bacterium]|nr:hypothetical protein [bacterium]|tara:strand:- start:20 stop:628 length:609 start_codon:yes stop_codon:yes gene_type:complete
MNTFTQSLKTIIPLTIVCSLLVGYQYLGATWTEPGSNPPNDNAEAPINTGATDQVKNAGLSVDALAVFGDTLVTGTTTSDRVNAAAYCDENGQNCNAAGGDSIGVGQTWQEFTIGLGGQRKAGTVYTNDTGKPIMLSVVVGSNGVIDIRTSSTSSWVRVAGRYDYTNNLRFTLNTVVPNNHQYRVDTGSWQPLIIDEWAELR